MAKVKKCMECIEYMDCIKKESREAFLFYEQRDQKLLIGYCPPNSPASKLERVLSIGERVFSTNWRNGEQR